MGAPPKKTVQNTSPKPYILSDIQDYANSKFKEDFANLPDLNELMRGPENKSPKGFKVGETTQSHDPLFAVVDTDTSMSYVGSDGLKVNDQRVICFEQIFAWAMGMGNSRHAFQYPIRPAISAFYKYCALSLGMVQSIPDDDGCFLGYLEVAIINISNGRKGKPLTWLKTALGFSDGE